MRSVGASDDAPAAADLTARARIRDAAIARFAEDGFGTGLRAIAADAGVSVGLVAHHFGSKAGLRRACDEHVASVIRDAKSTTVGPGAATQLLGQLAGVEQYAPVVGYVLRTLQGGGAAARTFVEHVIIDAEEYLARGVASGTIVPSRDEAARVRHLTYQSLGALVLAYTLERDSSEPLAAWFARYTAGVVGPALELLTEGLLTERTMLDTYLGARQDAREEHS